MKTLLGWIVGVFGLGLFVGSFYGGTVAVEKPESDASEASLVECGPGRQAMIDPSTTPSRIRCIATTPAAAAAAPAPVARPVAEAKAAPTPGPAEEPEEEVRRSTKESALIIGASAGAGAGIGAIAKGKKGAALGAAIGGVAGTVYDLATRNPKR